MAETINALDGLVNLLKAADDAYYNKNEPVMTDEAYDEMVKQYRDLTGKTWMRMGEVETYLEEEKHTLPMKSLFKVHTLEEALEKLGDVAVVLEPKIDGMGLEVRYRRGLKALGITRGNGIVGGNVTGNVKQLRVVPERLNSEYILNVRGEIYLTRQNWGIVGGENARNSAAGILRRTSDTSKLKHLDYFAYIVYAPPGTLDPFTTESEALAWLQDQGFSTPHYKYFEKLSDVTEDDLADIVKDLGYDTDGVVIKVDSRAKQVEMGWATEYPRYAVAYKFEQQKYKTTLQYIEWNATMRGRIVPKAIIAPTRIDGTTVTQATLNNRRWIETKLGGVMWKGQELEVWKGNGIIPQVGNAEENEHPDWAREFFLFPQVCPACGGAITRDDVDLLCANPDCPPKLIETITRAGEKRKNLDIDGLGDAVATALVESELVETLADLFTIHADLIAEMPFRDGGRFGVARATKLKAEIEKAKAKSWDIVLHALGCPDLGHLECRAICAKWSLQELLDLAKNREPQLTQDLLAIKGMGKTTTETFIAWLKANAGWLKRIVDESGLKVSPETKVMAGNQFKDQTWVITGTLSKSRADFVKSIEDRGGLVSGSVSKKTNYLLAGEAAGSKLEKANQLGVTVVSEAEFSKLLGA